ncbi:mannonate dehydratase [Leptolyngbya sp. GB1-A1]
MKAKAYVEQQGLDWYILSAKYGLLHRDRIIEPYEQTLHETPAMLRKQWAEQVFQQLTSEFPDSIQMQIFAGRYYRQYLVLFLESANYTVITPLSQLGIGQQLQWFDQHLKR